MTRKIKFIRADTFRYFRIGKNRPKLQKWRRPRGKHNKLRLKRFGHPLQPGIGFGSPAVSRGKISGLIPKLIHNVKELENISKNNIIIIAKVGARKKLEIIKKAQEAGIKVDNIGGKK